MDDRLKVISGAQPGVERVALDVAPLIEVEGLRLPLAQDGPGGRYTAGPVPPRVTTGPTEIVIHAPAPFRPSDAGGKDTRTLGVQVASIAVSPAA